LQLISIHYVFLSSIIVTVIILFSLRMQLTTCCKCCSLKTGTIFSGACGIVSIESILHFLMNYVTRHLKNVLLITDTCRDFFDPDLYGKCRMENNHYRYLRQNSREDNFRNQSLYDYSDLHSAHSRCFKGKIIHAKIKHYRKILPNITSEI